MTEKTHYRKNKDPKFLNGEDLKYNLTKDVTDGMSVEISGVNFTESFDPNTQEKTQVAELRFKNLQGVEISKGVIPGKWAFDFMKYDGIKSPFLEDWVGKKLTIYAHPDRRFGHVVRFKKHVPSFDFTPYLTKLKACKNIEDLAVCFKGLDERLQKQPILIKCKDEMKASYESN